MIDSTELMEVFSTDNATEAEIACAALRSVGIKCEVVGERQAGLTGIGIMEIKLLVRAQDSDRAHAFLKRRQRRL